MKKKTLRFSRTALSVLLVLCMLASCLSVSLIPTGAAQLESDSVSGGGSKTADWYMYNSIQGTWDSGGYLLNRDNGDDMYSDIYLKPDNGGFYWRYWSTGDNNKLGARTNNVDVSDGNDNDHHNGVWGGGNTWQFSSSNLGSGTDFYRVRIHLDPDGGDTSDSYAGWTWVTSEVLAAYSATLTTKNGGTETTSFVEGDTVSLEASAANGIGTASYSYSYQKSGASSWTTVSGTSFVPPEAGTYTVKVTATDGGVITSGDSKNALSARTATAQKTITVVNPFDIAVQAKTGGSVSNVGGTVSPAQFTGLLVGHEEQSITAAPNTADNYAFNGWTSANGLVTFADVNALTTTFTATGADTIYANFAQDTVYNVTVNNGFPSSQTTVQAGSVIAPTLTAAASADDEYTFTRWDLTGGVSLASGYSATDRTVKINASAEGSITAVYTHTEYIYFYGALQSSWEKAPVVAVNGQEIKAYAWIAEYENTNLPAKTLYSGADASTAIGANNCFTYYIGVYRVPSSLVGENVNIFDSVKDSTSESDGYCGDLINDQGRCYYTYSNGENQNHAGNLAPQKVSSVTLNGSDFDADDTITVYKQDFVYSGTKTAGQDSFTYTYTVVNTSTDAVVVLGADMPSSTGNVTFTPESKGITTSGNYKVLITTKDSKTGKIINSTESAVFAIQAIPTSATVSFAQTTADATNTFAGSFRYKNGSATAFMSGDSLRAGSVVTLTLVLQAGYTQGSTTVTGISSSSVTETYQSASNTVTFTFTVPSDVAAISITHAATEILHSVTIYRRYYNSDGTSTPSVDSTAYATITGVGIATAVSTGDAPTVTDYTFKRFVLPSSGVTTKTGDVTTAAALTVNATEDNKTIYIDYWETVYDVTVQINTAGRGTVSRGNTTVSGSTTTIGNINDVTLTANNNTGYAFDYWQIIPASGKTVTLTDPSNASSTLAVNADSGSTAPAEGSLLRLPSLKFRTNGTATVKAYFRVTPYSISAHFPHEQYKDTNVVVVTDTSGTTIQEGEINQPFIIQVTLDEAYEIDTITGTGISSTMPTPTVTGNVYKYQYTLGSVAVDATVTLKAKTPTLSALQIKDTSFSFVTPGATNYLYYKQPVTVKASTEAFATITYTTFLNATSNADSNRYRSVTGVLSGAEASVEANPDAIPDTANGTKQFYFTATAVNQPAGITQAATTTQQFVMTVKFNDTQKVYYNLKVFLEKCIREITGDNPYYKTGSGAQIDAYNSAYDEAKRFIDPDYDYPTATHQPENSDYPAYDADTAAYNNAIAIRDNLMHAYDLLMTRAKLTKVYVLSKYAPKESGTTYPMQLHVWRNGTGADWDHFNMYPYDSSYVSSDTRKMTYEGKVTKDGDRYLYSFTFAGHINLIVWRGSSATDTQMDDAEKLTGDVTNLTAFQDYYINVYDTTVDSTSVTAATDYADFDHTWDSSTKKLLELGDDKNAQQIIDLFQVAPTGSLLTAPGITVTNTSLRIEGPIGKASSGVCELVDTSSANYTSTFTADKQGKYFVYYTTKFGTKANDEDWVKTTEPMMLWVAFDDIDIYVDMNDNVGIPILNFLYHVDANQDPTSSASDTTNAYLPYEMDLVTGSDSIYKYTVKISKLEDDYFISLNADSPINISYITVENEKIGSTTGGFNILSEARITGEVWLKADSTNMKTFNVISYGSASSNFLAVVPDGNENVLLASAVSGVHGTGIITDVDEIYNAKYAGRYDAADPKFSYGLKASVNQEVTVSGATYYFDKWIKFVTPGNGLTITTENDVSTVTIPSGAEDYADSADINFTAAIDYGIDNTYVALYKQVSSSDSTVRIEVTYEFEDYNTSDGNYIYDPNKATVHASYTKTIKVEVGSGEEYADINEVYSALDTICAANAPYVASNYFDYRYTANSAEGNLDTNSSKITATAHLTHIGEGAPEPDDPTYGDYVGRNYYIIVKNGPTVYQAQKGKYQQTVTLNKDDFGGGDFANPVWKDSKNNVLATGDTYNARFVSSGNETSDGTSSGSDCQVITLVDDSSVTATGRSVVSNAFTEVYYSGDTEMLRHNFYIIDYPAENTSFVGGGVLYATTDSNGNYRQTSAANYLDTAEHREAFIAPILGGDFETEYKAQTISNIGFRYKPFSEKEDVYRYSDELDAYLTMFEGTNVNSANYEGQKLRLFSFMVYDNNGINVIVSSEGYAEVSRYIPQS